MKSFLRLPESRLNEVIQEILILMSGQDVLLLKGEMAAGKTTFVRKLMEVLGGRGAQSPTFALHQRYDIERFGITIDHLDLFRMNSDLELDGLGFWDFFEDSAEEFCRDSNEFSDFLGFESKVRHLVIIEWFEKMNLKHLPKNWKKIQLSISDSSNEGSDQRDYFLSVLD